MTSAYRLIPALSMGLLFAAGAHADIGIVTHYGSISETVGKQAAEIKKSNDEFNLMRERAKRRSIFRILSWNVQTFGKINPERQAAFEMLSEMFSTQRSSKILAVQEVANDTGSGKFSDLLPGGEERWNKTFQNTNSAQDNGFFTQKSVIVNCEEFLFAREDEDGEWRRRRGKAMNPARAAHMRYGDFDFTLISLHLTFQKGDTSASAEEFRNVLRWLEDYFDNPDNDPDVILAGDFNLTTRAGASKSGKPVIEEIIEDFPTFRRTYNAEGEHIKRATELYALVDVPTSRFKGAPRNNYDHFIVSGDVFNEEFMQGSAGPIPSNFIEAAEKAHNVYVSDHLPISAGFISKGLGNNGQAIHLDQLTPTSSRSCWKRGRK